MSVHCMSHELLWMPCWSWQAACSQTWRLAVDKEHSLSQRYMLSLFLCVTRSPCLRLIGPSGHLHSWGCLYTSIYSDMWQGWEHTDYCVHCCQNLLRNPSLQEAILQFSVLMWTLWFPYKLQLHHAISFVTENFQVAHNKNISCEWSNYLKYMRTQYNQLIGGFLLNDFFVQYF